MDALGAGTVLTAYAVAGAVMSIAGTFALRRTGYRLPLYVGAVLGATGMVALALGPPAGVSAYVWLAGASVVVGIGLNGADPAARNAGLQLMPEQSGSIAALRTMGRRIGTGAAVPVVTAIMMASPSPALALAFSLAGFAVLLLVATPVISRVPDHRGAW
jgi:MFS family permease